jgi:hypothetical protein
MAAFHVYLPNDLVASLTFSYELRAYSYELPFFPSPPVRFYQNYLVF